MSEPRGLFFWRALLPVPNKLNIDGLRLAPRNQARRLRMHARLDGPDDLERRLILRQVVTRRARTKTRPRVTIRRSAGYQ